MKVNANYTWIKCKECDNIARILPGQMFESADDFAKLFECECKVVKRKPSKKVVKDAA